MNIDELMSGANAYTSLAEVAAAGPDVSAPETSPSIIPLILFTIAETDAANC
jgi:hypothetical protein